MKYNEEQLLKAEGLLRKLLAIHGMGHHDEVTAEAYPGAAHEEAEEALCAEVRAFFEAKS